MTEMGLLLVGMLFKSLTITYEVKNKFTIWLNSSFYTKEIKILTPNENIYDTKTVL